MGGKILEYEAKKILKQGKIEMLLEMVRDGFIPVSEAAWNSVLNVVIHKTVVFSLRSVIYCRKMKKF